MRASFEDLRKFAQAHLEDLAVELLMERQKKRPRKDQVEAWEKKIESQKDIVQILHTLATGTDARTSRVVDGRVVSWMRARRSL